MLRQYLRAGFPLVNNMKKVSLILGGVLVMALCGCSSKPDASDVKGEIKDYWAPCKLVKVTDVKKTNGIDHGGSYQMAITYKLELLRDVAEEDAWGSKIPKYEGTSINYNEEAPEYSKRMHELNAAYFSAQNQRDKFISENCPGPVFGGRYVFQQAFDDNMQAVISKGGSSLKKGETVEQVAGFTMVESENGWIPK